MTRDSGAGCDTPQVYFSFPNSKSISKVPNKVLRYFEKICVDQKMVTFEFSDMDVSNWDLVTKQWKVTQGAYGVFVGASSQDIRLTNSFNV